MVWWGAGVGTRSWKRCCSAIFPEGGGGGPGEEEEETHNHKNKGVRWCAEARQPRLDQISRLHQVSWIVGVKPFMLPPTPRDGQQATLILASS